VGVTLLEAKDGQCRWVLDSPELGAGTFFCGEPTTPTTSYCPVHAGRVYLHTPPVKLRPERPAQERIEYNRVPERVPIDTLMRLSLERWDGKPSSNAQRTEVDLETEEA
jgi:hypothetical protein